MIFSACIFTGTVGEACSGHGESKQRGEIQLIVFDAWSLSALLGLARILSYIFFTMSLCFHSCLHYCLARFCPFYLITFSFLINFLLLFVTVSPPPFTSVNFLSVFFKIFPSTLSLSYTLSLSIVLSDIHLTLSFSTRLLIRVWSWPRLLSIMRSVASFLMYFLSIVEFNWLDSDYCKIVWKSEQFILLLVLKCSQYISW